MLAIGLKVGWLESDKLTKLWPIFENAITACTKIGVMFPGLIDVKSAISSFRVIFLSAGSVECWLAKGAEGTDYEMLI